MMGIVCYTAAAPLCDCGSARRACVVISLISPVQRALLSVQFMYGGAVPRVVTAPIYTYIHTYSRTSSCVEHKIYFHQHHNGVCMLFMSVCTSHRIHRHRVRRVMSSSSSTPSSCSTRVRQSSAASIGRNVSYVCGVCCMYACLVILCCALSACCVCMLVCVYLKKTLSFRSAYAAAAAAGCASIALLALRFQCVRCCSVQYSTHTKKPTTNTAQKLYRLQQKFSIQYTDRFCTSLA